MRMLFFHVVPKFVFPPQFGRAYFTLPQTLRDIDLLVPLPVTLTCKCLRASVRTAIWLLGVTMGVWSAGREAFPVSIVGDRNGRLFYLRHRSWGHCMTGQESPLRLKLEPDHQIRQRYCTLHEIGQRVELLLCRHLSRRVGVKPD